MAGEEATMRGTTAADKAGEAEGEGARAEVLTEETAGGAVEREGKRTGTTSPHERGRNEATCATGAGTAEETGDDAAAAAAGATWDREVAWMDTTRARGPL